ncbi:hypothetical protein [Halococcus agarilyticus]|uniref:hypothetical protein n=1 Tax=Halococcus agarilyticus TaxID=1232219 RepID=UPI0006775D41|nr:hypothetical protein [Halococcus agarilyticus]
MAPEDLRKTFSEEERAIHTILVQSHQERAPTYSKERAMELADAQVMETRLTVELLDVLSEGEEPFPTHTIDAFLARSRDLRELENRAREGRRERRNVNTDSR